MLFLGSSDTLGCPAKTKLNLPNIHAYARGFGSSGGLACAPLSNVVPPCHGISPQGHDWKTETRWPSATTKIRAEAQEKEKDKMEMMTYSDTAGRYQGEDRHMYTQGNETGLSKADI